MKNLNFNTGVEDYVLNDKCTVSFNPTDIEIIKRTIATFDTLEALNAEYKDKLNADISTEDLFSIAHEYDSRMRAAIDGIFDTEICDKLFGDTNLFCVADGLPVWCNLILALLDVMDASAVAERAKTNPRLEKYLKKYNRKK